MSEGRYGLKNRKQRLLRPSRGWRVGVVWLLLALSLSGCWDHRETEDLAFVLTIGIDIGEEDDSFIVTYEVIDPGGIATGQQGEGVGGGQGSFLISAPGRTILDAGQQVQRRSSRRLFLRHLRGVVFGEELARQGIAPALDYLERDGQLRRTVWAGVARGEARDVLEAKPPITDVLGVGLSRLTTKLPESGGISIIFGDFLERFSDPGATPFAPALSPVPGGLRVQAEGTAVFFGDRLVGFFDARETVGLSLALGQLSYGTVLIASDEQWTAGRPAAFQVRKSMATIEPQVKAGRLRATIDVQVEGMLLEMMGGAGVTQKQGWTALEQLQAQVARGMVEAAITQAQAWRTDVFQLGTLVSRRFPQQWKSWEHMWPEVFAEAEIDVVVQSRLIGSGTIKESLPVRRGSEDL